jgi:hypothetical protein
MTLAPAIDDPPVPCPLCDYDLRAQIESRCPECGHRFSWDELRARQDRHPFLFEHHPKRNVRTFLLTLLAGVRPIRFWRGLRPTHAVYRARLIAYWLAACGAAVLLSMAVSLAFVWSSGRLPLWLYPNSGVMLLQALLRASVEVVPWIALTWLFAWPALTLEAFAIFRVSLGRARVRFDQLLRCAVYASDAVLWFAPALVVLFYVILQSNLRYNGNMTLLTLLVTVALLVMATRLLVAAGIYLRFHQSIRMALLTQLLVLMPLAGFWCVIYVSASIFGHWP